MLLLETLSSSQSVFQHANGGRFSGNYTCIVTLMMDSEGQELLTQSCYLIATFCVLISASISFITC